MGALPVISYNPPHGTQEPGAEHLSSCLPCGGPPQDVSLGSSALGSYCLRSLSLLKVFQECGGLTHSLPWVHSLRFIKPLSPLVILIQTLAHMLHRWSWQEESGDTFFAQDVKVTEELRRSRRDCSPKQPLGGGCATALRMLHLLIEQKGKNEKATTLSMPISLPVSYFTEL